MTDWRKPANWVLISLFISLLCFSPLPVYSEIQATSGTSTDTSTATSASAGTPAGTGSSDSAPAGDATEKGGASQTMTLAPSGGSFGGNSITGMSNVSTNFAGAATFNIPIEVPPGRGAIAPNLALNYNSQLGNGWVGQGWTLDMGAIQRSTRFGVNYGNDNYVVLINGSSADLVPIGGNYYAAKYEGEFLRYYYNSSTGG